MKQQDIIRSYKALRTLSGMSLPIRAAYEIFKLERAFRPQIEFQTEQEKRLIQEHGGQISADGTVVFEANDQLAAFTEALRALNETEIDFKAQPVKIPLSDLDGQTITPETLEALDGIVCFV